MYGGFEGSKKKNLLIMYRAFQVRGIIPLCGFQGGKVSKGKKSFRLICCSVQGSSLLLGDTDESVFFDSEASVGTCFTRCLAFGFRDPKP